MSGGMTREATPSYLLQFLDRGISRSNPYSSGGQAPSSGVPFPSSIE